MGDQLDNGAVLQLLQSLDTKIDRNFDLLVEGQKRLIDKFSEHEKEDNERFDDLHAKASFAEGQADTKAKFWGLLGAGVSTLLIGGWETIKHFWK